MRGELTAIWAGLGYDEINWTYRPQGKRLLAAIGEFSPDPFYVRPHYMFCSGSGLSLPHWGNGNVYHEDNAGVPCYDFTILDQAYDAIVGAGHHVLVELGFTPRALVPDKAAGTFTTIASPTLYSAYESGLWAFPPKDYSRWADLCAAVAGHVLDRYGSGEVSHWVWELWNEPDIFYWQGTPQQYYDLYTVTVKAIRRVLPGARVGGPSTTAGDGAVGFMRGFLAHCAGTATPLDYVSFHTKGSAFTPWRTYGPTGGPPPAQESPSAVKMLFEVDRMLSVLGEFADYAALPVLIDECDAGVPAHHGMYDNANFRFQNTEYYPVFQAKLMKKLLDVSDAHHGNVELATTWSFYFEGERYFEGTRSWLTAGGIEKPFMNAYRLFAKLGRQRLEARSDAAWPIDDLAGRPYGMPEEVDCLASLHPDGTVAALVWRHADDQYSADSASAEVALRFTGLPAPSYAHRFADVADVAHPADRVQRGERIVGFLGVHRSADDAERHRVDAHAASCVLDGQRPGNRVEAALGERRERGRDGRARVVDEAGGDADHVPAAGAVVAQHGRDGLPREPQLTGRHRPGPRRARARGGFSVRWMRSIATEMTTTAPPRSVASVGRSLRNSAPSETATTGLT